MATNKNARPDNDKAFLDAWRDMEQLLRDAGRTVQDIEANLTAKSRESDASKLRICRQIRNFLTHDGPGFVSAQPAMAEFIRALSAEIRRAGGTARTVMTSAARYGCVSADASVKDAARVLLDKRRDSILVLDSNKELLGAFDARSMASALTDSEASGSVRVLAGRHGLDSRLPTVREDAPVPDIPGSRCVVIDAKGRCVGVVNPERPWR